jgi:hypothetical protein
VLCVCVGTSSESIGRGSELDERWGCESRLVGGMGMRRRAWCLLTRAILRGLLSWLWTKGGVGRVEMS